MNNYQKKLALYHQLENIIDTYITEETQNNLTHSDYDIPSEEINVPIPVGPEEKVKKLRWYTILYNTVFYGFLCILLLTIASSIQNGSQYVNIMGYSPFYVSTQSMQSVIPRGALVISKITDTRDLKVGDDITFMNDEIGEIVTHRIIKVYKNYNGNGLSFQTQGVDNPEPDKVILQEKYVVGKVDIVIPELGVYMSFLKENFIRVIIVGVLLITFMHTFGVYLNERKTKKEVKSIEKNTSRK